MHESPGAAGGSHLAFAAADMQRHVLPQAMATQEANRAASNRMPPIWAIAAIVFLGWNEFFAALRNPLWLVFGLVMFLFGKVSTRDVCLTCRRSCSRQVACGIHDMHSSHLHTHFQLCTAQDQDFRVLSVHCSELLLLASASP